MFNQFQITHLNAVEHVVSLVLLAVHDRVFDAVFFAGPANLHALPEQHEH